MYIWHVFLELMLHYYYVQESSKTNHPQLLYEAKLYNALQGGSMCLSTYKSYFADCHTIICVVIVAILNPCSWYRKHKMVRHWWRWKHSCYRFTRTKPWRSVCLLWPEMLTEDGLDASGSDGNNSSSTSLGFIY